MFARYDRLLLMIMPTQGEITRLLIDARGGERQTLDRLFECVYDELCQTAHYHLLRQRPGETLNTNALVHGAYLKLVNAAQLQIQDRRHFFAIAAQAMRQVILDAARRSRARKRGGDAIRMDVEPGDVAAPSNSMGATEWIALDQALTSLRTVSTRLASIVELRFFAGLSVEETGEILDLSPRTVKRDWQKARAFLYHALGEAANR